MSVTGRRVIDRAKRLVGPYIRLPVPPYGNPNYWDGCYQSLGADDVFEWGGVALADLLQYSHQTVWQWDAKRQQHLPLKSSAETVTKSSSWADTLQAIPNVPEEPLLMLGCGNSRLGEDMAQHGWKGPIHQVDISSRVLDSLSERYKKQQSSALPHFKCLRVVQDDATVLSAFADASIKAVVDKGLLDALVCAEEYEQCQRVLTAVHRVLQPHGVYAGFSFSHPDILLQEHSLLNATGLAGMRGWSSVEVQLVNKQIYLYRFQKAPVDRIATTKKRAGKGSSRSPR